MPLSATRSHPGCSQATAQHIRILPHPKRGHRGTASEEIELPEA